MSTLPTYTYDPITPSDFRLFHITSIDPQIQFRLESFDIEEFPDYEALSYAWGTSVETESVLCNDATFTISRTLGDALRALHKHAEHWIWVDAICINQADNVEKAHQVAGMGDVYSYAETVGGGR
ncbi:hypothetical protein NEMBOFW57_001025 [Staphylotrichum longicolle]|uniref:Heterokaryon incompatibility domain-containing protein n=1 Tax=Staphylotrichum longicolle TaxID=669026 RepID=A0AAD4I0F8_9PEZI|nr:hypothetical protein NEMBOFW57_001025 [Staphylotrichum longicolle]